VDEGRESERESERETRGYEPSAGAPRRGGVLPHLLHRGGVLPHLTHPGEVLPHLPQRGGVLPHRGGVRPLPPPLSLFITLKPRVVLYIKSMSLKYEPKKLSYFEQKNPSEI